jgi:predicted dehydrogenase
MKSLRIAIVGCGAVVEQFYIPALKKAGVNVTACIDLDVDRATQFAKKFNAKAENDFKNVIDEFDAAIISLPHYLHASMSIDLLNKGKHVLVEKPMALNFIECDSMISAAETNQKVLAVGNFRRNYKSGIWLKKLLQSGELGTISSFSFIDGCIYSWPVTTDSFWKKEKAGGGVLFDTGAHTLDQFVYWLGEAEVIEYKDDSFGGVEADCFIKLRIQSSAEGSIELSRTRNLGAEAIIRTEKAKITIGLTEPYIEIIPSYYMSKIYDGISALKLPVQSYVSVIKDQIINWCDGIVNNGDKYVSGNEARKSISIIEECYKNKKQWELPWVKK